MSILSSKIIKTGFWVLMGALLLSGAKSEEQSLMAPAVYYDYTIQVSGSLNNSFNGVIDFETAVETTSKGVPFSTLKLKLSGSDVILPHSLEFLISRENRKEILVPATYRVIRNHDGFLNYFDGVFGFANINELGELPLFAKSGKIQIDYLNETMIKGSLDITLNNSAGKAVHVKGDFETRK